MDKAARKKQKAKQERNSPMEPHIQMGATVKAASLSGCVT